MEAFVNLAASSGVPSGLLTVLGEEVDSATEAIRGGVDKVIVTGSLQSGRAVLQEAAGQVTPVIAELSGCDPVFVLESADLAKAVAAITFGCKLNGGATCIAPQRVFVHASVASRLRAGLAATHIPIVTFSSEAEALHLAAQSPFALGASVFGEEVRARAFASNVCAGVVVINDMIVPTADPRMPFGGRRSSGFGKTRGAEGLLEMTTSKAVVVQRAKRLRHLEPPPKNAEQLFLAYLSANHAHGTQGAMARLAASGQSALAGSKESRMKSISKHNIGVIGSGLGGLSAACVLAARGYQVTVFEKNGWIGGKAAVLRESGYQVRYGADDSDLPVCSEEGIRRGR